MYGNSETIRSNGHLQRRMSQRGIRDQDIERTLLYGRTEYIRRAHITVVGRREVERAARQGVDIRSLEGIHVVCTPEGVIKTVYRNKQLNLREAGNPRRRRR